MKLALLAVLLCSVLVLAQAHIVDYCKTCRQPYKVHGCYKEEESDRELPNKILTKKIKWSQADKFTCDCAQKAKENNFAYFATRAGSDGKFTCWAGNGWEGKHGKSQDCVNYQQQACREEADANMVADKYCIGTDQAHYVYQTVDLTCSVNWKYVGCYKDKRGGENVRALGGLKAQGRDKKNPSLLADVGYIDWLNYDTYLPSFMCECATKAKEAGATYFGIQFYGECFFGKDDYARYGSSCDCTDECFGWQPERCIEYATGKGYANAVFVLTSCSD